MKLVEWQLRPNSRCPVMRLCLLAVYLCSLLTPARAIRPCHRMARGALMAQGKGRAVVQVTDSLPMVLPVYGHGRSPLLTMHEDGHESTSRRLDKVLILGAGWVGSRLAARLAGSGSDVAVTNRPGSGEKVKPPYFRPVSLPGKVQPRVLFEINDKATWANLPPATDFDAVVVTFPLTSQYCAEFFDKYLSKVDHVLCYSSTSIYQVDTPGQHVDENTTLKPTLRAQMEAHFLAGGASMLTISGIFGEPRGPRGVCACLTAYSSAGGNLNARSRINMVHVEDILAATCCCLEKPEKSRGLRLNVAGSHFQLSDLVAHCKHPKIPDTSLADYNSKVVSSQRLLDTVMPEGYTFVEPL